MDLGKQQNSVGILFFSIELILSSLSVSESFLWLNQGMIEPRVLRMVINGEDFDGDFN